MPAHTLGVTARIIRAHQRSRAQNNRVVVSHVVHKTPLDRIVDSIERGSKSPFGNLPHRNFNRSMVDKVILEGFIGPDTVSYEESSTQTFVGDFKKSHPEKVAEDARVEWGGECGSLDFRDHLDAHECQCGCGELIFIEGCTVADLIDVPSPFMIPGVMRHINERWRFVQRRMVRTFDIVTTRGVARAIGWLE